MGRPGGGIGTVRASVTGRGQRVGGRWWTCALRSRTRIVRRRPALFWVSEEPFDLGDELFTVSRAYLLRPPATGARLQAAHVIEKI